MFENLGRRLDGIFRKLRGMGTMSESNVRDAVRDVRLALLEADVNFKVVKHFTRQVTEKAVGREVLASVTPGQQFVKIIHDALVEAMGGRAQPPEFDPNKLNIVLLLGLQGSGKTTFAGKLARRLAKQGFKPMLVACDVYRAAAVRQIEVVGRQVGVPVYSLPDSKVPPTIARKAIQEAERQGLGLVIVDTAGRLHVDEVKMEELTAIKAAVHPTHVFLVADAMTGQDAVNSATRFHEAIGIDGVCLTKLDGDARGGAALSIRHVTGKPIVFVGVGEKPDDLEVFHPDRMAQRILGMGDVLTLVEKAQETFDAEQAAEMQRKLRKQTFTLGDFLNQLRQVKKMGPLSDLLKYIPGLGSQIPEGAVDEKDLAHIEAVISSMTQLEREMPHLMDASRKRRVAAGSGTTVADVNSLLKQFEETKKVLRRFMGAGGLAGGLPAMGGARRAGHGSGKRKKKKKRR
ncbi:signal recognition particle [candidate division BRC1 bacterium SM23_51]|nr:MAG: signal recognition particle [candidate division BRC1 bacterium SM23_51]